MSRPNGFLGSIPFTARSIIRTGFLACNLSKEMDLSTIESKIAELEGKSKKFITVKNNKSNFTSNISSLGYKTKIYISVFLIVFVVLLYARPNFIKSRDIDVLQNKPRVILWKRFFSFWIIISLAINTVIYAYLKDKN